jgi:hypothetical protein
MRAVLQKDSEFCFHCTSYVTRSSLLVDNEQKLVPVRTLVLYFEYMYFVSSASKDKEKKKKFFAATAAGGSSCCGL